MCHVVLKNPFLTAVICKKELGVGPFTIDAPLMPYIPT